MIRKIIKIDEGKCDGCGLCVSACHEGAIGLVNGKAKLLRDDYCDGLGNCLPVCPKEAISFEEREAAEFSLTPQVKQWPLQIKLVPISAQYFNGADLLIAADCTAYAYINFHSEYMSRKITIIGCPKLDDVDYSGKLSDIFRTNDIKSITVARMEVPCCGGIEHAVRTALKNCGKIIPWQVVTFSTEGGIIKK